MGRDLKWSPNNWTSIIPLAIYNYLQVGSISNNCQFALAEEICPGFLSKFSLRVEHKILKEVSKNPRISSYDLQLVVARIDVPSAWVYC